MYQQCALRSGSGGRLAEFSSHPVYSCSCMTHPCTNGRILSIGLQKKSIHDTVLNMATPKMRRMTFYVTDQMAKTLKSEARDRGLLFQAYLAQLVYAARMMQNMKAAEVRK